MKPQLAATTLACVILACHSASRERPAFWISIAAANFTEVPRAARALATALEIRPVREREDWAMLLHSTAAPGAMSFELFPFERWPRRRVENAYQAFRPRFARYAGEPKASFETEAGRDFVSVDGFQMRLPGASKPEGLEMHGRLFLEGLDLDCIDLDAQRRFYGEILGLEARRYEDVVTVTTPDAARPILRLQPGRAESRVHARDLGDVRTWISIATSDVRRAERWLRGSDVEILRKRKFHWSFFATDFVVADADGNPIQIVEYHGPASWREWGRRKLFDASGGSNERIPGP